MFDPHCLDDLIRKMMWSLETILEQHLTPFYPEDNVPEKEEEDDDVE